MNVDFTDLVARLKKDNMNRYDTILVIDGANDNRHGRVGIGKTNVKLALSYYLHPLFSIVRNVVIMDDRDHYNMLLAEPFSYTPICLDEAEHFWYLRTHGKGDQIDRVKKFMSNRKECKFHLSALPSIWDMDKSLREDRIQWRIRIVDRGRAELYLRNSPMRWKKKKDLWGELQGEWDDIPEIPEIMWTEYYRCLNGYEAEYDGRNNYVQTIKRAKELIKILCPECKAVIPAEWDGFQEEVFCQCSQCGFNDYYAYREYLNSKLLKSYPISYKTKIEGRQVA